jgi:hypothetical protein
MPFQSHGGRSLQAPEITAVTCEGVDIVRLSIMNVSNVAGQWRAAADFSTQTDAQSARPLHEPGWSGAFSFRQDFRMAL